MKKLVMVMVMTVLVALGFAGYTLADVSGKGGLKAGDELYVCNCGEKCPCDTMGRKAGKCTCGKEMVKAKVSRVEEGKSFVMIDGKERSFKTAAGYACACGAGCDCGYVSQKPGKCACGKEMKEVQ